MTVMSTREWCELTGSDLEALEEAIREAESDAITRDMLDSSTLNPPKLTPEAEARAREFLRHAGRIA